MPKTKYGDKTAKVLDNYIKDYSVPKWPEYFGKAAPVVDFARNYITMKQKNLNPSDKFFHCKANYDATTRGPHGEMIAKKMSNLREAIDRKIKGDSLKSSINDQKANLRGRIGAKKGKTLRESCPTHHSKYK